MSNIAFQLEGFNRNSIDARVPAFLVEGALAIGMDAGVESTERIADDIVRFNFAAEFLRENEIVFTDESLDTAIHNLAYRAFLGADNMKAAMYHVQALNQVGVEADVVVVTEPTEDKEVGLYVYQEAKSDEDVMMWGMALTLMDIRNGTATATNSETGAEANLIYAFFPAAGAAEEMDWNCPFAVAEYMSQAEDEADFERRKAEVFAHHNGQEPDFWVLALLLSSIG